MLVKDFLHTDFYDEVSDALMRQRGIVRPHETMHHALDRTISTLTEIDGELNGSFDPVFEAVVWEYTHKGLIAFGTPVLANTGRTDGVTAASTVLNLKVDGEGIDEEAFYQDSYNALASAAGTGYDLSEVGSPATALVRMNEALDHINTRLVTNLKRPVASMATLRADHPGVLDFVRAKRQADFSKWRFNISLFVTEALFEAAEAGQPWALRNNDGLAVSRIDPNKLLQEIADCAHYCGEPGILFKDRMEADNPTPEWPYQSTAPCAEIAMAAGEACEFSYINVGPMVTAAGAFDHQLFGKAVRVLTRLLDASVENTLRQDTANRMPLVRAKRRIGIGITGFADVLVRLRRTYTEPFAARLAAEISEELDYYSKRASVALARKRGSFPAYSRSRYLEREWLVRKLDRSTGIIPRWRWEKLCDAIESYGIRNASTSAMAPTGTSSAIIGCSKSLEPIFSLKTPNDTIHKAVAQVLSKETSHLARLAQDELAQPSVDMFSEETLRELPYLRTARQISPGAHLAVQQGFQTFLDESLAKTINLPQTASPEHVLEAFWAAYRQQLKGLTVFRDGCLAERNV